MSWLLFCKDSANREQSKTCFNYAEVQPIFAKNLLCKDSANREQSKTCF